MNNSIRYFIVLFFLLSISLFSKIRHIYESDGAQAIQDSIDVPYAWDTVMVHNGIYYIGDLTHPWGLHLKDRQLMSVSPDSAPYCILTALSSSRLDTSKHVIWDTLPNHEWYSLIQGFTITKGKGFKNVEAGGGIYIANWYDDFLYLEIQDNIITENSGGITIERSDDVIIQRNQILNNEGFGVGCWGTNSIIIIDNLIKGNKNYDDGGYQDGIGGGIFFESGATSYNSNVKQKYSKNGNKIENNIIINNYAEICGGGIGFGLYRGSELNGNFIALNETDGYGGGIHSGVSYSQFKGINNILIANRANKYGCISLSADSIILRRTFSVDNGSYKDSSSSIECIAFKIDLSYSNLYYNTYQKNDIEVIGEVGWDSIFNLENNFWWVTDSAKIDSLIDGPADFMPFMLDPVHDAPGEPIEIYSVLNYSSDYSSIVDSIGGDPDTLYLEITGHDNKHEFQEAAVAILKSRIYSTGVAVAILETDTSTGIYRGKAIVKTTNPPDSIRIDDIYQIIRVHPVADTIRVYANMDTTEMFKVYYRCQSGVEEELLNEFILETVQNLTFLNPEFRFHIPEGCDVELSIYDICGRLVDEVVSTRLSSGWHTVQWEIEKAGVYIYQIKTAFGDRSGKIVIVR